MVRILSKSQIGLFKQCPYKWKRCYIDKISSAPSYAQQRGIKIHKSIENFYKQTTVDMEKKTFIPPKDKHKIKPFLEFEQKRLENCKDIKYFKPLYQELKLKSNKLFIRGIIDAVYINPDDDGIIIIDYKSGKYRPDAIKDYQFELAIYKILLDDSNRTKDKVKYWGILFVDHGKLFFEEVDNKIVQQTMIDIVNVRKEMESGIYKPQLNEYCNYCQFKSECSLQ